MNVKFVLSTQRKIEPTEVREYRILREVSETKELQMSGRRRKLHSKEYDNFLL
jgi:hypothetical protein